MITARTNCGVEVQKKQEKNGEQHGKNQLPMESLVHNNSSALSSRPINRVSFQESNSSPLCQLSKHISHACGTSGTHIATAQAKELGLSFSRLLGILVEGRQGEHGRIDRKDAGHAGTFRLRGRVGTVGLGRRRSARGIFLAAENTTAAAVVGI